MSSEEENGIVRQPADTCPLIDSVVSEIESILGELEGWKYMDEKELREACDYAEWKIKCIELEPIRDRVRQIREWGQQWKELALELKQDIHEG